MLGVSVSFRELLVGSQPIEGTERNSSTCPVLDDEEKPPLSSSSDWLCPLCSSWSSCESAPSCEEFIEFRSTGARRELRRRLGRLSWESEVERLSVGGLLEATAATADEGAQLEEGEVDGE